MQPFENDKIWPSGRCLGIGGAASPFVVAIHVMPLSGFSHPENPLRGSERLPILICNQSRSVRFCMVSCGKKTKKANKKLQLPFANKKFLLDN